MKFAACLLLLSAVGLVLADVTVPNVWCNSAKTFCVQSLFNSTSSAITFAVSSAAKGWVGLGIGSSMSDADVWVGWNPTSGTTLISDRTATGHSMPAVDANTQVLALSNTLASVTPFAANIPTTHSTIIYFARYVTAKQTGQKAINVGSATGYIYAWSNTAPVTPTDSKSSFGIHDDKSTFSYDFTTSSTAAAAGSAATTGAVAQTGAASTNNAKLTLSFILGTMLLFLL
ncbi:hypothetical protein HK096_008183 [Nowakowskiella sp. JEL0078]|nr:hypothetical protein HK096_008183 [Nowakowskiella sp. JEL0078]